MINIKTVLEQARRIWHQGVEEEKDCYLRFRRTFELKPDKFSSVSLAVAAETDFEVWVNGMRLPGTQYQAYPQKRYYTVFNNVEERLVPGINCLAVLCYHLGIPNATHALSSGGLILAMTDGNWRLVTDSAWKVSRDTSYLSGQSKLMTFPVGMRFEYNAQNEEDWHESSYDDRKWDQATVCPRDEQGNNWTELVLRPVPVCIEKTVAATRLIWQGEYLKSDCAEVNPDKYRLSDEEPQMPFLRYRHPELAIEGYSDSWNCGDETYPVVLGYETHPLVILPQGPRTDGVSLIFDCGCECAGFLEMDWECDEPGVTVEVHHGEHLDDGRVRSRIAYARYIDTIHLGIGHHHLRHTMRRIGARYLQLYISGMTKAMKLHYVGLSEQLFPLPTPSAIFSPDSAELRLRKLSERTLQLCMHEHYEDCPWREQSLYAGDSRIQMLCGYYIWGNYDFAAASLELLAQRFFDDCGYLSLCAPSGDEMTIASYSFIWIAAVRELVLYGGMVDFLTKPLIRQRIDQILEQALKRPLETCPGLFLAAREDQLFKPEAGGRVWNFYEWCGELSWDARREQSLYQVYLSEALYAAADLNEWAGLTAKANCYRQEADALMIKTQQLFWDEKKGCFTAFLPDTRQDYYEHVQSMMLGMGGKMPENRRKRVYEALVTQALKPCTWYNWIYLAKAMAQGNEDVRIALLQRYHSVFDRFAFNGSTALWEVAGGGYAGRFGGSLCHGWSAVPAWFIGALELGVRPVEPGFRKFEVKPAFLGQIHDLEGDVPTPHGFIRVAIHDKKVSFDAPSGTEGILLEQ